MVIAESGFVLGLFGFAHSGEKLGAVIVIHQREDKGEKFGCGFVVFDTHCLVSPFF
jgi:hypothetical protein